MFQNFAKDAVLELTDLIEIKRFQPETFIIEYGQKGSE
jgi:hypothetical protein